MPWMHISRCPRGVLTVRRAALAPLLQAGLAGGTERVDRCGAQHAAQHVVAVARPGGRRTISLNFCRHPAGFSLRHRFLTGAGADGPLTQAGGAEHLARDHEGSALPADRSSRSSRQRADQAARTAKDEPAELAPLSSSNCSRNFAAALDQSHDHRTAWVPGYPRLKLIPRGI